MSATHFCPHHGRDGAGLDIHGLRCDCPDTILDAVAPIKRGKWVAGRAFGERTCAPQEVIDAVVDCANRAIDEAVIAGYRLGLAGGVPASRIQRCEECAGVFLGDAPGTCLTCYAKRSA